MAAPKTGKNKVIEALNTARSMELLAISQYMNQHYNLDGMDYGELAKNIKLIAIDEMRHAERFAERIKELGGDPTTAPAGEVKKGQALRDIYPFDDALEENTIATYGTFLNTCREAGDVLSAKLFEAIIEEEQAHLNYFANVAGHIKTLGDTYLSKMAGTPSSTGPASKGFVTAAAAADSGA